jgi:hypothetical protein
MARTTTGARFLRGIVFVEGRKDVIDHGSEEIEERLPPTPAHKTGSDVRRPLETEATAS